MAHEFDTGLARAQRTLLRDGVVSLLSGLLIANGGYLKAVIPFGGVVRGYTDEIGLDQIKAALNGRAPAVAVALGDGAGNAAGMGGFNYTKDIDLIVYHYANNVRALLDGRTKIDARGLAADTNDPGLDVMLEHVEELLIGQRVGAASVTNPVGEITRSTPTIKQIRLVTEEELATENALTIWRQRFAVTVARTINPRRGVTQLLEEIRTVVRPSEVSSSVAPEDDARPGDRVLELENDPYTP